MKLIRSLMGRRQFLTAAGVGSASALALGKFIASGTPALQPESARASETPGGVDLKMVSDRYSHLLSPLKIGNQVLKNRFLAPQSTPHFLQGPENFPAEVMRDYYVNMAKNGAGIISVRIMSNRVRKDLKGDSAHMVIYDLEDAGVLNYMDQMIEGIHIYGSKACAGVMAGMRMPGMPGTQSEDSEENNQKILENVVTEAKFYESHGFDAIQIVARGNEKMTLAACEAVKAAVPDMLTITEIFVREPSITQHKEDNYYKAGGTVDEAIAYAKKLEGKADIAMVRIADASAAHATTWNSNKSDPYAIHYAQAIKKSGTKVIVAPGGGFQDLDLMEGYLKDGKSDMFTLARAFICDWEYGQKMAAGRGEDVTPCIRCNKCHGEDMFKGPWYTVCSVNPKVGIPAAVKSIRPPGASKKVAVVGGGPAGMKAALTAAERGHRVTLYEKSEVLGGLARHADYSPYKWAIKGFKNFLAHQMGKAGVEVLLKTEATPEMIRAGGYDTILVAVGSDPVVPRIPGADGKGVYNIVEAYSNEKSMGKNVVFIGGGEFGADVGMYLANAGHNVTMVTAGKELFPNNRPHYPETIIQTYEDLKNFLVITEAVPTGISSGKVTYKDAGGTEKSLKADSVVIYAGFKPRKDEALKFYGTAKQFFAIGDCSDMGGNIQKSIRSAFYSASEV